MEQHTFASCTCAFVYCSYSAADKIWKKKKKSLFSCKVHFITNYFILRSITQYRMWAKREVLMLCLGVLLLSWDLWNGTGLLSISKDKMNGRKGVRTGNPSITTGSVWPCSHRSQVISWSTIITFNIINQEMSLSVKIIINQNLAIKCPQILKYLINETRIMVFTHFIKKACQV